MPTEPPDRRGESLVSGTDDDEFTFAVHDLGRERPAEAPSPDLGFVAARPSMSPPPAPVARGPAQPTAAPRSRAEGSVPARPLSDGFVIREANGVAPAAPVDALVVGAAEPVLSDDSETAAAAAPSGFRITSASTAAVPPADQLWTTRTPATPVAAEARTTPSRRGWSTRQSEVVDRSAHATMLRLREEAVNVCWKAAWIAVTSSAPRWQRKRGVRPV